MTCDWALITGTFGWALITGPPKGPRAMPWAQGPISTLPPYKRSGWSMSTPSTKVIGITFGWSLATPNKNYHENEIWLVNGNPKRQSHENDM